MLNMVSRHNKEYSLISNHQLYINSYLKSLRGLSKTYTDVWSSILPKMTALELSLQP